MNKLFCAFAIAFAAPSARAAVIDIDLLYSKAADSAFLESGFGRRTWISMSFTPGITGTLDRIDIQIAKTPSGNDDLRFRFGSGETITNSYAELFSIDLPAAIIPATTDQLFSLDLSGEGIFLLKGQLYSVVLSSILPGQTGAEFVWVIGEQTAGGTQLTVPPYAGGQASASIDQGVSWDARVVDRPLRTWMTAASVPAPANAFLLAGLLALAVARPRRAA